MKLQKVFIPIEENKTGSFIFNSSGKNYWVEEKEAYVLTKKELENVYEAGIKMFYNTKESDTIPTFDDFLALSKIHKPQNENQ